MSSIRREGRPVPGTYRRDSSIARPCICHMIVRELEGWELRVTGDVWRVPLLDRLSVILADPAEGAAVTALAVQGAPVPSP
jgi:hypothetical protein